jgi:hypothetical protein
MLIYVIILYILAMRKVAIEDFDVDFDIDTTILDDGTLMEKFSHNQIHEIGS